MVKSVFGIALGGIGVGIQQVQALPGLSIDMVRILGVDRWFAYDEETKVSTYRTSGQRYCQGRHLYIFQQHQETWSQK